MFTEFLYHHLQGVLVFISAQLLIGLVNLTGIRRLNKNNLARLAGMHLSGTQLLPKVSVLLPVRNEADNIEACARSLLMQNYPNYELIVLDDQSQDNTREILLRISAEHPRLSVMNGRDLPQGWVGKNWACHQMVQAATGDYLLFTDADTRHHPDTLADSMSVMLARKIDFLTGMPRQDLHTWGEQLVVPFLSWIIFAVVPVSFARRVRLPLLSAAVGQFLLFRKDAYQMIGGHRAALNTSIEDIVLARRIIHQGLRWDFWDLSDRVFCRMYQDFASASNGISKNLFGVFQYNLPVFAFAWIWLLLVFVEPFVLILATALGLLIPGPVFRLALAASGLSLILWGLNNWKFRLPLLQAVFYPLTMILLFIMAARSAWYDYTRRQFDWKGRNLPLSK